ncbi:MAG: hypothetical protein ABL958_04245 [Bdellovibrionia bacterium]
MEKMFYEIKPVLFFALAFYAVFLHPNSNTWLSVSGWLLMGAVSTIFHARYSYRHAPAHRRRR